MCDNERFDKNDGGRLELNGNEYDETSWTEG